MKKILVLLLSLLLLALVGCNNNTVIEPNEREVEQTNDNNNDKIDEKNNETNETDGPQPAIDFELETMDGTKIKLSELKGKNVMINFWATWCSYCVLEMPDLEKLGDKYKDDDFVLLAVNVGESKETVEKFIEEHELNLTVLLDKDSTVANKYGLRSFPSTLTVDKEGNVVTGYIGMMTYDLMEKMYGFFNEE